MEQRANRIGHPANDPDTRGSTADGRGARPDIPFQAQVHAGFIRALRNFWRTDAYCAVVADARASGAHDPDALEQALRARPSYRLYAWLERHSQQAKYYGRWGAVDLMERQRERLSRILDEAAQREPQRLRLDPAFAVPDYVRDVDTHQHGGGVWSDDCDAFAYEFSSSSTTFSGFDSSSPYQPYVECIAARLASTRRRATRILDLGSACGKSAMAVKQAFPDAEVVGADVCAPAMKLAHLRAIEAGQEITWHQLAAEDLSAFPDASFDAVASHWLYHEMPPHAIRRALREARRVLRPGGVIVAYDMYLLPGGAIGRWLQSGYAARNNEPFAHGYVDMDMRVELEAAGFRDVQMRIAHPEPDEAAARGELPPARTHYITMISATVPA